MGWSASGSFTTAAATQPLYWTTVFNDATFVGPIAVAANFACLGQRFEGVGLRQ
jgi:hypothetical protein